MSKLTIEELEIISKECYEKGLAHSVELMNIDQLTKYRNNCLEAIERLNKTMKKSKKGGLHQHSTIEIIEDLEGYIVYIDAKLAENEEPKGMAAIDAFLEQWKNKCFAYYVNLIEQYKAIDLNTAPGKERVSKRNTFLYKLTKAEVNIVVSIGNRKNFKEWLLHDLDFEVLRKRVLFIQRITKSAGNIINSTELYLGNSGEINGKITGDKKTVTVKTISAGGYNIQCFHYRILVK